MIAGNECFTSLTTSCVLIAQSIHFQTGYLQHSLIVVTLLYLRIVESITGHGESIKLTQNLCHVWTGVWHLCFNIEFGKFIKILRRQCLHLVFNLFQDRCWCSGHAIEVFEIEFMLIVLVFLYSLNKVVEISHILQCFLLILWVQLVRLIKILLLAIVIQVSRCWLCITTFLSTWWAPSWRSWKILLLLWFQLIIVFKIVFIWG